ncbi:MAG: hypothetical protein E5X00_14735, partial [Mesorhizobium sp.]
MENEPLIDDALKSELAALYQSADRHYHGLPHIEAMLALAAEHRHLLDDPEAVEAVRVGTEDREVHVEEKGGITRGTLIFERRQLVRGGGADHGQNPG